MFVVVTVVACWLGWNLNRVNQRARVVQRIVSSNGRVVTKPQLEIENRGMRYEDLGFPKMPILWRLLGAETTVAVEVPEGIGKAEVRRLFPEADVIDLTPDCPGLSRPFP